MNTTIPVRDLRRKWRLLRGRASWIGPEGEAVVDTQLQLSKVTGWDRFSLSRALDRSDQLVDDVPRMPEQSVGPWLHLFGLDLQSLHDRSVDVPQLINEPFARFCARVHQLGGTDFRRTSWDSFVEEHGLHLSESRGQGKERLCLHRVELGNDGGGLSGSRLLQDEEPDPAESQGLDLPRVQAGERAVITVHPAAALPASRDLARQPRHAVIFQDVRIDGERQFLLVGKLSPVRTTDRFVLPPEAEIDLKKSFRVPGMQWGNLRRLVALITDAPIGDDLLRCDERRHIEPASLDWLADLATHDPGASGASGRQVLGHVTVWVYDYLVLPANV